MSSAPIMPSSNSIRINVEGLPRLVYRSHESALGVPVNTEMAHLVCHQDPELSQVVGGVPVSRDLDDVLMVVSPSRSAIRLARFGVPLGQVVHQLEAAPLCPLDLGRAPVDGIAPGRHGSADGLPLGLAEARIDAEELGGLLPAAEQEQSGDCNHEVSHAVIVDLLGEVVK
jgi:hypothetical protein